MTQISAILNIPTEQVDLMQAVMAELKGLRAAIVESDILTEDEAAAALKVSISTLRKWRKEGWVPYFSEGKLIKFERKALLTAYKAHFGAETHFGILKILHNHPKRRAS
jgi:DNA-binding transcriptional regulator YiaG